MSVIGDKYASLGGAGGFLGQPTTPELPTRNGLGSYRHFQGGSIFARQTTPIAFEVHGLIRQKWAELDWDNSPLQFPITDETPVAGGNGRVNIFDGGFIAWTPALGAHEVHGAIYRRLRELGSQSGSGLSATDQLVPPLGFPITDELATPGGRGRYNHFENGSIYWTSTTQAHEVTGFIKAAWAASGWEQGPLGYPVDRPKRMLPSTLPTDFQDFEHGTLYDWFGNSRMVISTPAVMAVSEPIIGWDNFNSLLPDGDRISVEFTGHTPNGNIQITLKAGPGITWWKAVTLWSPARGDFAIAWTQDGHTNTTVSIPPSAVEPGNVFLRFHKAKFLGVHTLMYWLARPDRLIGNNVTFTWLHD